MEYFTLYNGFQIPCIGLGTYPNKENLQEIVPTALNAGYRMFDTSDNYDNEKFIGYVYQKLSRRLKKDVIIITKFSQPLEIKKFDNLVSKSMKNIYGEPYTMDVYLLHWPYPFLYKKIWRQMENLYLERKCSAIGVCNFNVKHLNELIKDCRVIPMINQFECHPFFIQKQLADFCQNLKIQVMSYSPLARIDKQLVENTSLRYLADKYKKNVAQIILRWNIQHHYIPIPSSKAAEHIESNFNIFDFYLSSEEMEMIDSLDCGMRVRYNPNKRFNWKEKCKFMLCSIFAEKY